MATITSATSGLASATSTWVGGVVPGTTFAGTRTTTGAAVALGAVSIPVSSGAQVVTAGKRIKVAGDPNTYRVATGVAGGSAGNIIIDAPGLLVAIPASATTVSVDMVDDKVVVAHPGTNNRASNLYQLNGARSAGDTSIPVDTGTGTIVAGECVQVLHQLGTDEDDNPYYDNNYYKVTTGITGAGTLVIAAPGLAYAVAGSTQIINRGHVVEVDGSCCWGDDTSSGTIANNAIPTSGTVKASRSVSSRLVLRGTLAINTGGTVDFGDPGVDAIPATITARVVLNDSATMAAGKHGIAGTSGTAGMTLKIAGAPKTKNTRLSSDVAASTNQITVDEYIGWSVGDRVCLASDTDDYTRSQLLIISGGTGPTFTLSGNVAIARLAGCRVGNLSSNVEFASALQTAPSFISVLGASSVAAHIKAWDFRLSEMGTGSAWAGISANANFNGAFVFGGQLNPASSVRRLSTEGSGPIIGITPSLPSLNSQKVRDCNAYASAGGRALFLPSGCAHDIEMIAYRIHGQCILTSNSDGAAGAVVRGEYWGQTGYSFNPAVELTFESARLHATTAISSVANGRVTFNGGYVGGSKLQDAFTGTISDITYNGTQFDSLALTTSITAFSSPKQSAKNKLVAVNGVSSDNRVRSYWQETVTDLTTRKRSTYAVKIQPKVANSAITYVFALPAVSGVQQTIKGSLRFDATYGTATPPRIDLSGQGVTASKTCAAVADAWDDFTFTFTPTSTGDITATVTVQSASTAGFAWLDGVYHYPMTQSVRHFGYQFLAQTALVANTKLSVTNEATVLAYPVAVNHGVGTITISGDVTAAQVGDYLEADLCQTANQAQAVHYTLGVGGAFTTSYDVVVNTGCTVTGEFTTTGAVTLTGTGDVDGVYTDSTGRHVKIIAPNLIAGTWAYLYNVTDDSLISKVQLTGAGLSVPVVYAADKTVEYRFGYSDATTRKYLIRGTGVLSSSGLQIIDSQVDDSVYAAIAGDPATFTEFAPDFPNLQVDADETFLVPRMYKWLMWAEASSDGIELMAGAVSSDDGTNVRINVDVVDAMIQNPNAGTNIFARGGYIYRSDGTGWIVPGPGIITPDFGRAYVASGSGIAADVWAAPTRTLTGPEPLVLDNGEQLLTVNTSTGVPKYLARG